MLASNYVEIGLCCLYAFLIIDARRNFKANGLLNKCALWVEKALAMGLTPFVAVWAVRMESAYTPLFWLLFFSQFAIVGLLTPYNWFATAFDDTNPIEILRSLYGLDPQGAIVAAISLLGVSCAYVGLALMLLASILVGTASDLPMSSQNLTLATFPLAGSSAYFIMTCMTIVNRKLDREVSNPQGHDLMFRLCATEKAVTVLMIGICPVFVNSGDLFALGFCSFWGAVCQPTNHFAIRSLMLRRGLRKAEITKEDASKQQTQPRFDEVQRQQPESITEDAV